MNLQKFSENFLERGHDKTTCVHINGEKKFLSILIVELKHRVPRAVPSINIPNMKKDGSFNSRNYVKFTWYA